MNNSTLSLAQIFSRSASSFFLPRKSIFFASFIPKFIILWTVIIYEREENKPPLQDSIQPSKGGTPTSNEAIERMYEHSRGLIGEGQLHKRSYRWRYDSSMMVYRQNPSIAAPLQ